MTARTTMQIPGFRGDVIAPEYDSMIAKVISWGRDREEARARLQRALDDMAVVVPGVQPRE